MLTLVIGNKNLSSWSLRPWLLLKQIGEPFSEKHINLRAADSKQQILHYNPAGKVPALLDSQLLIHDSLAIAEYLAETYPAARLWPDEAADRAIARAVSAEMHAGFMALRSELPFNSQLRCQHQPSAACAADIARVCQIWRQLRERHAGQGAFLFGRFSIADAMFAPVALRFVSYGIALDETCKEYVKALLAMPSVQQWQEEAEAEQAATQA